MAPIDRRLYLDQLKELDLHKEGTPQEDDNQHPSLGLDPREDSKLRRQCLPPAEAKAADELEDALRHLKLESEGSCREVLDLMWQPRFREWHWLDDESDGYRGRRGNGIEDDRYAETNYDGLCWAGVFDAMDAVIAQYMNNTPPDLLLFMGTEVTLVDEVIIELLRWSKIVLVSNSQATLLYNSFDRIMSLLDSPHPRIIVAALDVLWNYNYSTTNIFKRVVPVANTQTTSMTEKIQMGTRMRLSWLTEGWENYNPSYDILCCCSQAAAAAGTKLTKSTNDMPPQLDPQIVRSTAMSLPKSIDFIFDYQQPITHEMKSLHCTLSKGQQGIDAANELMEKLQNTVTEETVLTMLRYRLRHSLALLKGDSDVMLLFTAIRLCTVDITLQIKPHHTPPPCGNMGLQNNTSRGDGTQQQRPQQQQQPALGWGPSGIGSGFLHMYLQTYPAFLGQLAALPFSAVSYAEMVKGVSVSRTLPIEVETVLLWCYRLMSTVLMEATLLGAGGQQLVVALASSSNLGYMTKMIQGSRDRLINALTEQPPAVEGSALAPPQQQQQPRFTQSLTVCSECIDVMTNLITAMQYPNMLVTVGNMSMILDFLIRLSTHEVPLDWHHNTVLALVSCCKCLEIALEYSPSCFGILFRDLGGLDKLLDVVASLSKDCYDCWKSADNTPDGVAGGEDYEKMLLLSNRRNELQAVLNLLKTSVHNIDPGVGMNLNEALSGHEVDEGGDGLTSDAIRRRKEGFQKVMVRLYGDGAMAIGAQNVGYLSQLMHYICDNDPIIIPTVLGPNGELLKAVAKCLSPVRSSSFALGWTSTALSSFSLHNRGAELLRDLPNEDNPLTLLVRMVMSGQGAGVRPISPLAEKVTSDLPMMLSQSLEDIVRNRNELAKPVVEAVFAGLQELMDWADDDWNRNHKRSGLLSAKLAPACRLLTSLLQTHSSMAKLLVMTDGKDEAKSAKPGQSLCDKLMKLATHPSLPKGSTILAPVVMSGANPPTAQTPPSPSPQQQQQQSNPHYHPIVATFRALENAFYNNLSPSHVGGSSSSSSPSNELNTGDCLRPVASLVVDDAEKLHTQHDSGSSTSMLEVMRSLAFGLKVFGLVHTPVKENAGGLFGNSSSTGGGSSSTRDYLSYSLLAVTDTVCKYAPQLLEEISLAKEDEYGGTDITLKLNSPPSQVRRSRFMRDTIDWRKAVEMMSGASSGGEEEEDVGQLRWTLWKVVKQFIEAVAKLANTPSGRIKKVHDMFFSSLSQKQISNAARIASVLLSNAFIDMTKRYHTLQGKAALSPSSSGLASRAKKRFITEMFDLLVKCHVEDRSHHTRILSIDAMFKMGGFGKEFTDMIVDISRDPLTDETLSASVLGYCERITSIKRMENSSLTQPSLFPTIDKSASLGLQSFLKVDGYKLVSSLQVRLSSALLPLWRDDAWLARESPPTDKEEDAKQQQQQPQPQQQSRYVMSARACGSMVKLFTHVVEPDSRVIDITPATTAATPSPGGEETHPAEAHIAEMLRGAVVRRLPQGGTTPVNTAEAGSPKETTDGSGGAGGDPNIGLDNSSAAHYAQKNNFIAVLEDRVTGLKGGGEGQAAVLDLPTKLTPSEVRRNAEDVGKDFISRCVNVSKLGGQPGHCADVIARVAQNCNRVRLGVTDREQEEEFREDEVTRVQIHIRNLLHVVEVVGDEFIKEINTAADDDDGGGGEKSPDALQCLAHVLAYLVNSTERVRATLWKGHKADRIIEGLCHYCEERVKGNDDDRMMDAALWKDMMMDEATMLGATPEGPVKEDQQQQQQPMLPSWLTEAVLVIEGLCEEPYLYTGTWDALQIRLLSSVMRVLTAYEENRGPPEDGSQKLVGVMVPSPDLTRAALEVMSLLVNREANCVAVFATSPGSLMSLLCLRRASSYPEITTMLASILSKLLENKQFIATVMDLALMQLSRENEKDKKMRGGKKGGTKKIHHHDHHTATEGQANGEQSSGGGAQSSKGVEVDGHLAYKLSDILANPMLRSLMLKDPHTVQEVLLKDLVKKKKRGAVGSSTSRDDDEDEEGDGGHKSTVMVALAKGVKEGFRKSDGRAATAYLSGVNTANFPYSILTLSAEFLLRALDLLSSIRRRKKSDCHYPLAISVEAAMYFFDTLVSKIQFAGASKATAEQSAGSISLTPLATSRMLLNKPIRIEDFIITTVGDKLSSLPVGGNCNGPNNRGGSSSSSLKSAFHLISGCWTQLCASCTPDYTADEEEAEDRVRVLEWYKGLAQRHMHEPFIKYSHAAKTSNNSTTDEEEEEEELSWVMSTYRRFAILYAFLLKVSTMDAVDEVLGKDERQQLTENCNEVLGSIMLHRPYSADLSESVLACMEILTRPPRLQNAGGKKKTEVDDNIEEEEDDEDSSPSVIYHFGPPAGFLLDDEDSEEDDDDDDELIPTMIVEPVIGDDEEEGDGQADEDGAGGESGQHDDDDHEGEDNDDDEEGDWGDDDEVYDRLGEEDEDALLDELEDDDEDDDEQEMILQESEIHPAEAQPDELEEERDLQLEREQMENIDPDDMEEEDDDDDGSSNDDSEDDEEEGDEDVDDGDVMDVLRDVVMGATASPHPSTSAAAPDNSAGEASTRDQQQQEALPHGPSDTPQENDGGGDHSTGRGSSSSSSDTGSSSFDDEDDGEVGGEDEDDDDDDVILEFDDGHHQHDDDPHEDDMMDEDESSSDDDEDDDEEGEGSDDDDDDAFPMFGFDGGEIAPHRARRRRGGGEDGLMLPLLEDGPGRMFRIRELGPRRRAGLGAVAGGGQGSSADRGGIVNPNGVPPSAVLSEQSLLLPKPPRKVWSFTDPDDGVDKPGGRYSAVHPFFEGRQNNRMPPLVSRPHGDPSSYPATEFGEDTVDVISGVIEPPSSRALVNLLCNRVQTAVAEGLREETPIEAPTATTPKPGKRKSVAQDGERTPATAPALPPKKKARRGSSRSRRSRGHEGRQQQEQQQRGTPVAAAASAPVMDEGTQTADTTAEIPPPTTAAGGSEGAPVDSEDTQTGNGTAAPAAEAAEGGGSGSAAAASSSSSSPAAAPAAAEGVDTSQYPQACIDAANRMRVPIAEVVRRSGIDLSVLVELPPDLQREAIFNAIGEMDDAVLGELRIQYRRENPQTDNNHNNQDEHGDGGGLAAAAGLNDANETAEFLNALPPDLRRDALISMQFDDPGLVESLPVEMRAEALAASQQQARRQRRVAAAAAQIGRPRRGLSNTSRLGGSRSAQQRQAEEQSRRLRAMGDSIRGSVDNIMHSTTASSSSDVGGGGGASAAAAPRRIGAYLNNPFLDERIGGGEAITFDDTNPDDGALVVGRRFDNFAQRLTSGSRGHQQLAAIIREFESLASSNDTFLFEANRGNRRGGSAITINAPGVDFDGSWGAPAGFIGGRQGRRRPDLGGDWASTSSVRTAAQSPNGGMNTLARRGAGLSPAALDSLNLGLQSPLRIVSGRGFPSSGTGGGQAIDRTWLQSPLQTEDIAHMYSNGSCSSLVPAGARSTSGQGLADGAQNLLRLLFMRYQPLRPLVDKTIFNVCLEPKLEDAVLQALVQALLSLACSSNRRHGHSVHGWSFVVEGGDGSIGKSTTGASSNDDENETFPPWYLYEPPMPSPPTARSAGTTSPDPNAPAASSAVTASPTVRALARSVGCGRVLNAISFLVSTIPRTRQWFASPSMTNNALLQRTSSTTISKTVSSPSPKRASTSGVKRRRSSITTMEPSDATEVRRSRRLLSRTESATDPSEGSGSARKLQRTKSVGGKEAGKSTMVTSGEAEMGSAPSANHSQQKANRSSQPILVAPVNVVVQLLGSPLLRSSPAHTLFLVTVLVSMLTLPTHTGKANTHHAANHNATAALPAPPPPPPPPASTAAQHPTPTSTATASAAAAAEVPKPATAASSPKKAAKTTNDIIRMHVRHLQRAVSGSSVSALCAFLANDNPISGCQVNSTELDKALAKTSSLIQALASTGDRHKMVIRKQLLIHVRQLSSKVSSMLMDLAEGRTSPEEHTEQQPSTAINDTSSGILLMTSKRLLRVVQCWSDALLPKGSTLTPEAEEAAEKEFDEFLVEAHVEDLWPGLDKALTKYDNDPEVLESQLASVSRAQAALQARRENEERHRQQQQQYARTSSTRNPISPHHDSLDRVERPERAQPSQQQQEQGSGGAAPGQRPTNRHLPSGLTSLLPVIELYLIAMLPTKSDRLKVASARRGMANNNGATSPRAGGLPKTPSASSKAEPSTAARPEDHDPRHQELSRQARAVASFCESHRRPLNALIKNQPSHLLRALNPIVYAAPQALDFDNKRQFFRSKLKEQSRRAGHMSGPPIRLHVRRHEVFVDSYHQLQHRKKSEMMNKIIVQFVGEEGVDAGGLVREWFGILAREIFNPNYALFLPANGRPSTFLINPASSVNPDHLSFFRFCGRIIGKAIYENQRLDCYFVRSFYKHMLGRPVTWHDMEAMDPDYYRNLKWILECQDDEMLKALDLTFTIEESDFGKTNVVELIPNGSNTPVTQQNKHEYVQKVCEHKMTSGIQDQLNAFLEGFHELIPADLVGTLFDDKELELLIAGLPTIDVEDLKRNTEYVNYSSQDPQIKWFWKCLEEDFTEDEMAWFLQFVTGSTQVPLEGFQALTGMRGPQKFSIHKAPGDKTRLPSAHTCFNQLDLPDYDTEEVLKTKLKQAVCEAHEGFGFV